MVIRLQRNYLICVLRLNPVNFLSLISYIVNISCICLFFIQSINLEVSVDVGDSLHVGSIHSDDCTDECLFRFLVDYDILNLLRSRWQAKEYNEAGFDAFCTKTGYQKCF